MIYITGARYRCYQLAVYEDCEGLYELRVSKDDETSEVIYSNGEHESPNDAVCVGYGFIDGLFYNR